MIEQKTPRWMLALAVALGVLLPILAALQYHWLDRLSEDEAVRMRTSLQLAADRFGEDVERELTRVSGAFTLAPVSSPAEAAPELTRRWKDWKESAPLPELVKMIYWLEPAGDWSRLYRFAPNEGMLEATPWPDDLAVWRRYVENVVAQIAGTRGLLTPHDTDTLARVPVLIVPVPDSREETGHGRTVLEFTASAGILLIVLDESVMSGALFPALAEAYISGGAEPAYDVAVVRRTEPSRMLYGSDPRLQPVASAEADIVVDFGRLGWSPLRALPPRPPAPPASGPVPGQPTHEVQTTGARTITEFRIVERHSSGSRPGSISAGAYRLLIRHKVGSLEAAVAVARRRNVGISFGILGLLAAAAALFFVAERRARQLAAQQAGFVAGVSHELRTPLTVIRMAGENLADGVVTDPEQTRAYGRAVRDEGLRLTRLVDQVLELAASRATSRDRLSLEPVRVDDVVEQAVAGCRPLIEAEGVEVSILIQPDLPSVLGNGDALSSAVRNLLVNAVKYRGTSRIVWIEAKASDDARVVRLAVRDHGMGIPPDEVSRLFEPFFRGRQAQERQIHGSGLGLSLVKHIADVHGGTVSVESEPGNGSTFTLSIPAAASHA